MAIATKKKKIRLRVQCMECGKRFTTTKYYDIRCPKCHGYDIDADYTT